jgi:phage shock protein C
MYCCNCGRQMEDEARFCSACGTARPPVRPPMGDPNGRMALSRIRDGKKIAGVCGGIARYFDVDVTLIRIMFILVTVFTGIGAIAYPVCWIAMPQDPPRIYPSPSTHAAAEPL